MTRFVPIVALVPEGIPEQLAARAAVVMDTGTTAANAELLAAMDANGWTHEMLVAGAIITMALLAPPDPHPGTVRP